MQVGSDPSTAPRYDYVYNGHRDVTFLTDASGSVVASYLYDSWGNLTSSTEAFANGWTNPYRYDGRDGARYDASDGLYWLAVRAYDPTLGRFLSRDPLGRAPLFVGGGNPYVYAGNNPLSNVDPSGQRVARASATQVKHAATLAAKTRIVATRGHSKICNMNCQAGAAAAYFGSLTSTAVIVGLAAAAAVAVLAWLDQLDVAGGILTSETIIGGITAAALAALITMLLWQAQQLVVQVAIVIGELQWISAQFNLLASMPTLSRSNVDSMNANIMHVEMGFGIAQQLVGLFFAIRALIGKTPNRLPLGGREAGAFAWAIEGISLSFLSQASIATETAFWMQKVDDAPTA